VGRHERAIPEYVNSATVRAVDQGVNNDSMLLRKDEEGVARLVEMTSTIWSPRPTTAETSAGYSGSNAGATYSTRSGSILVRNPAL
jgi:hypothetical protein